MELEPGSRLGPYEITSRLGAGGMGEVFEARDTRLDRSVAIKVLPAELAESAQFKLRFEREAKTISQLNHPNICTLYDVGDGYLVMELLEGETLAERIGKGPLPLADVFRYGIQIAEALDRAHRQGIIHRDLKPANVMITKSGAKLLDFGLAKSEPVTISHNDLTQQKALTSEGTILGTFQYMSPEQLEGAEADQRTDIFAFGCVLYEMMTGSRAFDGKTKTSLIAAIVGGHPRSLAELQPMTPPALEHVISRCLEKDPEDRWQTARDVAEELKWIGAAGSQAGVAAPLTMRRRTRERLAWSLLPVAAIIAAAGTWGVLNLRKRPDLPVESSITTPKGLEVSADGGSGAIAPDGSMIVLVVRAEGKQASLAVRSIQSAALRPLSGTEDASFPFWSPDSRKIGFFAGGRLKTIDATGGAVQNLAEAKLGRGGSWNSSGTIIFAPGISTALMKVSASGGTAEPATKQLKEESHRWPEFLPDGKHFLYSCEELCLGSLDSTTERKVVLKDDVSGFYAAPGYLLFLRDGILIAQPFDVEKGELKGEPATVAEGVGAMRGRPLMSVARNGSLIYQPGAADERTQLVWVDRDGKDLGVITPAGLYFTPSLFSDGRRLAVDVSDAEGGDIWVFDLARNVSSRLTYETENASCPIWTADGKRVVYFVNVAAAANLLQVPAGGTGTPEVLVKDDRVKYPTSFSRDGRWMVFTSIGGETGPDIWLYSTAEKKAKPWLATPFREWAAMISPDGKWMVYQSDESGKSEIYVRGFPESEEKVLISNEGGEQPSWSSDGREIYYVGANRKLTAVPVSYGTSFDAGAPVPLFDVDLRNTPIAAKQYDVAAGGKRFLLNRRAERSTAEPLVFVQHWTGRLAQK